MDSDKSELESGDPVASAKTHMTHWHDSTGRPHASGASALQPLIYATPGNQEDHKPPGGELSFSGYRLGAL